MHALSQAAAANEQSYIHCEAALADLLGCLKQSQQLVEACDGTDGSSTAAQLDRLRAQLIDARCMLPLQYSGWLVTHDYDRDAGCSLCLAVSL